MEKRERFPSLPLIKEELVSCLPYCGWPELALSHAPLTIENLLYRLRNRVISICLLLSLFLSLSLLLSPLLLLLLPLSLMLFLTLVL
jgi:hypothetical protein